MMAAKRRCGVAVAAVVLLLCLSSAAAAKSPSARSADAELPPKAAGKASEQPAAAISNPQHAPQFPEDTDVVRKGQGSSPVQQPPKQQQQEKQQQDKQQQPAATPTPAAAPVKQLPTVDTPKAAAPEPKPSAPKQQPAATPAPKQEDPKPTPAEAPKQTQQEFKQEVKKIEPLDKEEKQEKEDPCRRVPGCLECTPHDPKAMMGFATRRLQQRDPNWGMDALSALQGGDNTQQGNTKQGKTNKLRGGGFEFLDMGVHSAYDAKDLPMCTKCNATAGYVSFSRGRCACAPGHGDTSPTGTCNKCPNGYFSQGGFRAVCVECEGVAFSNVDHTACVCASGWYGVTSYATKQASCNMCPGSRPVSPEGARSASDCFSCPTGQTPNEIYSECVDPSKIPPPEPESPTKVAEKEEAETPAAPPLFNSSTFANAREQWTLHTRNTQNHSHPITDFFGSLMENVVMGKNITSTAKTPGDLLYQVLTKPATATATPKMPSLPNIDMQNPTQIGAGVGAALAAMPAVLGSAVQNGGKISDVVDTVKKAVEDGSKSAGNNMAASGSGWDSFLKGLSATAPKDSSGKSEVADLAKSLGDLFGAAGKVATEVAEKSDNTLVKSIGGLLSAAKKGETIEGPLTTEAALIAAPDAPGKADDSKSWSNMLSGLLSGQAVAGAPAPAADAAPGNEWTKMFSGFTKSTANGVPAAPAAPAPAGSGLNVQQLISGLQGAAAAAGQGGSAPASGTADIGKMLAALTAPAVKVANPDAHSITAAGKHYVGPGQQSSPSEGSNAAAGLLSALAKYSANKGDGSSSGDSQKAAASGGQAAGGLGGILGGLFTKSSSTISLASNGNKLGAKIQQVAQQAASGPAAGFLSVPSAPPKGSAAIKSGKFGFGKAKTQKHGGKAKGQ